VFVVWFTPPLYEGSGENMRAEQKAEYFFCRSVEKAGGLWYNGREKGLKIKKCEGRVV
jgi:hypothetical protein